MNTKPKLQKGRTREGIKQDTNKHAVCIHAKHGLLSLKYIIAPYIYSHRKKATNLAGVLRLHALWILNQNYKEGEQGKALNKILVNIQYACSHWPSGDVMMLTCSSRTGPFVTNVHYRCGDPPVMTGQIVTLENLTRNKGYFHLHVHAYIMYMWNQSLCVNYMFMRVLTTFDTHVHVQ